MRIHASQNSITVFLFIPLEEVAGKSLFVQFQVAPPSGRHRGQNSDQD